MNELELLLLQMWKNGGIKEIYKYKHRIKAFREPLTNIELVTDVTSGHLFQDVEDIANHRDSCPEEYKVSIESLLKSRSQEFNGEQGKVTNEEKTKVTVPCVIESNDSLEIGINESGEPKFTIASRGVVQSIVHVSLEDTVKIKKFLSNITGDKEMK